MPDIFRNCQIAIRTFFKMLDNFRKLFPGSPAPAPGIFQKVQLLTRHLSGLFTIAPAFSYNDPQDPRLTLFLYEALAPRELTTIKKSDRLIENNQSRPVREHGDADHAVPA